jgi:ATP-dependent Lon protease
MNPMSPDYSIQLNYLQNLVDLPWGKFTKDNYNLKRAQEILDNDHYGLEKVKDRILEHLAVLKLKGDLKAPILCLYGPPGVGKTSLGQSVAKALSRKYVRISLGGLHDEAEIRGHRKTYIGAMPGRIIQSLNKAQTANPVFILDEIDKVGNDFRGDPSSALLEVLDPQQNGTFYDNYLEVEFDLSKVLFIATANSVSGIKPALRDRMEMIDVSGYVVEEKVEIAKRHLIQKQLKEHGLTAKQLSFTKEAIEEIVAQYTRESGVRALDQKIAEIVRKIAKKIGFNETYEKNLKREHIKELLGAPKFQRETYDSNEFAGVVTGLAWTAVGGTILVIESSLSKGGGKLTLTGNLGEVMKESAVIALEYIKSRASDLEINEFLFNSYNIHLHVPEGAVPKDGPSAGITMATAMASLFTQRKVKKNLAMTGEITLRGKVLPVGGIKEKILAAKRAEIHEIILSKENKKDIEEINELYLKGLSFHYVETVEEVLEIALLKQKVKKPKIFELPSEKKNEEK